MRRTKSTAHGPPPKGALRGYHPGLRVRQGHYGKAVRARLSTPGVQGTECSRGACPAALRERGHRYPFRCVRSRRGAPSGSRHVTAIFERLRVLVSGHLDRPRIGSLSLGTWAAGRGSGHSARVLGREEGRAARPGHLGGKRVGSLCRFIGRR